MKVDYHIFLVDLIQTLTPLFLPGRGLGRGWDLQAKNGLILPQPGLPTRFLSFLFPSLKGGGVNVKSLRGATLR